MADGESSTDTAEPPTASGTNRKLLLLAIAAAAILIVIGLVVSKENRAGDSNEIARNDTQIQAVVDGYKARFPWTTPMMDAMMDEGLLKTTRKVNQLFMYFSTACVNGTDMRAGKPEATQKDLGDQQIQVTAEQSQRLNAAQEKMCTAMPPGSWADQPLQTKTYPGLGTPTSPRPT